MEILPQYTRCKEVDAKHLTGQFRTAATARRGVSLAHHRVIASLWVRTPLRESGLVHSPLCLVGFLRPQTVGELMIRESANLGRHRAGYSTRPISASAVSPSLSAILAITSSTRRRSQGNRARKLR